MKGLSTCLFRFTINGLFLFSSFLAISLIEHDAHCQGKVPIGERVRTELSFILVQPKAQLNPLAAQKWVAIFEKLGVVVQIRQPRFNDTIGVEQLVYGTIRRVKVIAQLDRQGSIRLPEKTFRLSETEKLNEWINELKLYGSQGAPKGQPMWGLKKAEFDRLHAQLVNTVEKETTGLNLTQAIQALDLPEQYPVRLTVAARTHLKSLEEQNKLPMMTHDLRKFSKGTALAMVLRNYSLGFSPSRLPNESSELTIDLSHEIDTPWPVGWDPESSGLKRLALSRSMYIAQMIELQDLPLSQLLPKVRSETKLDLFIDPQAVSSENLQLDKLLVNFPRKRTSWSLCLRTVLSKIKLTQQLRVDENNRPFIWITKYEPKRACKK